MRWTNVDVCLYTIRLFHEPLPFSHFSSITVWLFFLFLPTFKVVKKLVNNFMIIDYCCIPDCCYLLQRVHMQHQCTSNLAWKWKSSKTKVLHEEFQDSTFSKIKIRLVFQETSLWTSAYGFYICCFLNFSGQTINLEGKFWFGILDSLVHYLCFMSFFPTILDNS